MGIRSGPEAGMRLAGVLTREFQDLLFEGCELAHDAELLKGAEVNTAW